MMTRCSLGGLALVIAAWAVWVVDVTLVAQDWPQFLGPRRDGTYTGASVAGGWSDGGPTTLWERQVGAGFAGPVVDK